MAASNWAERADRAIQQAQQGRRPENYAVTVGLAALTYAVLHLADEIAHTREQVLVEIDKRRA